MMYRYEYPYKKGWIVSAVAYPRQECVKQLLRALNRADVVQFGRGFWTLHGVFLGHIVASENEQGYTVEK